MKESDHRVNRSDDESYQRTFPRVNAMIVGFGIRWLWASNSMNRLFDIFFSYSSEVLSRPSKPAKNGFLCSALHNVNINTTCRVFGLRYTSVCKLGRTCLQCPA